MNKLRRPARKSFYHSILDKAGRRALPQARNLDGLDQEIDLMRVAVRKAFHSSPRHLNDAVHAVDVLRKVVETNNRLTHHSDPNYQDLADFLRQFDQVPSPSMGEG